MPGQAKSLSVRSQASSSCSARTVVISSLRAGVPQVSTKSQPCARAIDAKRMVGMLLRPLPHGLQGKLPGRRFPLFPAAPGEQQGDRVPQTLGLCLGIIHIYEQDGSGVEDQRAVAIARDNGDILVALSDRTDDLLPWGLGGVLIPVRSRAVDQTVEDPPGPRDGLLPCLRRIIERPSPGMARQRFTLGVCPRVRSLRPMAWNSHRRVPAARSAQPAIRVQGRPGCRLSPSACCNKPGNGLSMPSGRSGWSADRSSARSPPG